MEIGVKGYMGHTLWIRDKRCWGLGNRGITL
jgi:hypothetical protein